LAERDPGTGAQGGRVDYGPPFVLGRRRSRAARFAGLAALATLTAASAAFAADGTAGRGGASAAQQLGVQARQAVLGLYALDSRLAGWRTKVAALEAKAAALRARRASLRQGLAADRVSLRVGKRALALDLRAIYEHGSVDPVAVVLGASSLTKGFRQLDELSRAADESKQIVTTTAAARRRLLRSQALLAVERRRLTRSLAAARQAEARVAAAAAARQAYVSSLRAQEQAAEVRTVETTAQSVQRASQRLQQPTPPPSGKRHLVVSATCYDLSGTTATGMPVGEGVVAVDPSVIPLGTKMYVPGYGDGVAADVGGGIKGDIIDLWMHPSQCAAWGRRTVTITLF
jgi:3D (Asp-Asp-Asp) domain-containing protein